MMKWKFLFVLTCLWFGASITYAMNESNASQVEQRECPVCFDDVAVDSFMPLGCGHASSCLTCMRDTIDVANRDHSLARLRCTHDDCNYSFRERDFRALLPADQVNQILHAVEHERRIENREVNPRVYRWMNQPAADGRGPRARMCIRCTRILERNQGCNHMRCGGLNNHYEGCGAEFCYMCLGDWNGSHLSCNRPVHQERLARCSQFTPLFTLIEKQKALFSCAALMVIYVYAQRNKIKQFFANIACSFKRKFSRKKKKAKNV